MSSESYRTVLWSAKEAKDWPLVALLHGEETKDWYSVLRNIFERACENRDDKAAARYFGMWMQAIDDGLLEPFTKAVDSRSYSDVLVGDYAEVHMKAATGRAEWAKEAWHRLPNSKTLLLSETSEAILTEIANRWRNTLSEEEADTLFDFLTSIMTRHDGEYKILVGVLRKTTDISFAPEGLTRHFLQYYRRRNRMSEIANVLAMGRTRNALDLGNEIALTQHLQSCSDPAFRLAEKFVEQVGAMDRAVSKLLQAIQSERERRGDREKNGDPFVASRRTVQMPYMEHLAQEAFFRTKIMLSLARYPASHSCGFTWKSLRVNAAPTTLIALVTDTPSVGAALEIEAQKDAPDVEAVKKAWDGLLARANS
jgi:hypothetical protein